MFDVRYLFLVRLPSSVICLLLSILRPPPSVIRRLFSCSSRPFPVLPRCLSCLESFSIHNFIRLWRNPLTYISVHPPSSVVCSLISNSLIHQSANLLFPLLHPLPLSHTPSCLKSFYIHNTYCLVPCIGHPASVVRFLSSSHERRAMKPSRPSAATATKQPTQNSTLKAQNSKLLPSSIPLRYLLPPHSALLSCVVELSIQNIYCIM